MADSNRLSDARSRHGPAEWVTLLAKQSPNPSGRPNIVIEMCGLGTLYGRKCRSPVLWAGIGEVRSIGPELVQETTNKVILIKEKLKAARDCQKGYVGNRRKHLELKLVIK
ncbi:hypothetical protein Tco_1468455 [Tanacetum coccineum]